MAAALEVDRYSSTFARVRVIGHDPHDGVPFSAPIILATTPGPMGEVIADWQELRDIGGAIWFDDGGTLGKCVKADGSDETAVQFAQYVKYPTPGDWLGVQYDDTTDPTHARLVVLQHYPNGEPIPPAGSWTPTPPPVEEPPAPVPTAPISGTDIAKAIGYAQTTPDLDEIAITACDWVGMYLKPEYRVAPYPGPVREACLAVAIDILQSRNAAGGQSVGFDVTGGAYRMGSALWGKVAGLISPFADQGSEIG